MLSSCSSNSCLYRFAYNPGSPSSEHKQVAYPWLVDVPDDFTGGKYGALFDAVAMEGSVCLGLLRPRGTAGAPKAFVHTSPPPDLMLVGGDQLYILAPPTCSLIRSTTD